MATKIAQFKFQCDQVKQILDQQRSQPIKRPDQGLVAKNLQLILNRLVPNTTWLEPWTALWDLYDQPEQYLLNDDGVLTTVKIRWWDLDITALEDDFAELRKSLELGQDCGRRQVVKLGFSQAVNQDRVRAYWTLMVVLTLAVVSAGVILFRT